mgnify:FL=1
MNEWLADTTQVEVNQSDLDWARENSADIQAKRDQYLAEWNQKQESEKQTLKASSGE